MEFLDSTCKWYHTTFVFFWLISLRIMPSAFIYADANGKVSFFIMPEEYFVLVICQAPLSMILQARILEWVAMPSSGGSSQPSDRTQVSCIASGFLTSWAIMETHMYVCVCVPICFLTSIKVVFISWVLWIMLQWTWGCSYLLEILFSFPLAITLPWTENAGSCGGFIFKFLEEPPSCFPCGK